MCDKQENQQAKKINNKKSLLKRLLVILHHVTMMTMSLVARVIMWRLTKMTMLMHLATTNNHSKLTADKNHH